MDPDSWSNPNKMDPASWSTPNKMDPDSVPDNSGREHVFKNHRFLKMLFKKWYYNFSAYCYDETW